MDKESQKRKIQKYLQGKITKGIDAFCIYQWIERCYFHGWWDLAIQLSAHIPPNSLSDDFNKRSEFLVKQCQIKYIPTQNKNNLTIGDRINQLDEAEKKATEELFKKLGIDLNEKIATIAGNADGDLTGKAVSGFTLLRHQYPAYSHKDAFLKIIAIVFQQYPEAKNKILAIQGRKRKYFSRNPNDLSKFKERIADSDIYAELNENANTLYRRGKEILKLYGIDYHSFNILTY